MSDTDSTLAAVTDTEDGHDSTHGHASGAEPLGPVDVQAWAYAIVAGAVGLLVALVMFVAGGRG